MTPQPLQKESLEALDELYNFVDGLDPDFIIRERISIIKSRIQDTRSRAAPSPAPIRSMREDEDGYISWQQMNERALEEHDAAIAAQAREDVLEKVIVFCKSNDCVQKTYGDMDCLAKTDTECIICFCQSISRSEVSA